MVRALWGGLRGLARAVLATSLLHILTHLYLVDDRRQYGHHGGMSRRGTLPPSIPLGARTHRASPDGLRERPRALSDQMRCPGSRRMECAHVRTWCDLVIRRPMTKSVPLDAPLDGDGHNGASSAQSVAHRDSDFCASEFVLLILAQTPSISEFVRVRGNRSPRPFSFSLSGIELLLIPWRLI